MKDYKKMLTDAVRQDGLQFCLDALQEECAELIQAISHKRRKRVSWDNIIEEMADVTIMVDMCRVGIDNEIGFNDVIARKSKRIGDRVKFKRDEVKNGSVKSAEIIPRAKVGDSRHVETTNRIGSRLQGPSNHNGNDQNNREESF